MKTRRHPTILYVDDSLNDHLLFREAARLAGSNSFFHLSTIDSARSYFRGRAPFSPRELYPLPGAVLLDWNIPPCTGADLLAWLRPQRAYANMPVVVYSNADEPGLSSLCYAAGASHFVTKPAELQQIVAVIHALEQLARGNPRAGNLLAQLPTYRPRPGAARVPDSGFPTRAH